MRGSPLLGSLLLLLVISQAKANRSKNDTSTSEAKKNGTQEKRQNIGK